jgi:hypothetical protein
MAVRRPVVRHFIACERVERSQDRRHFTLHRLIHAIRPLPGATYPRIHPELSLFAMMTDGQGRLPFTVQIVMWDDPLVERVIYTTATVTLDLGQDPLFVHGWPIRLRNLPFARPDVYEFRLVCDGEVLAREPVRLRETP